MKKNFKLLFILLISWNIGFFANAFGQDPEFFAFYRAMQAYEKALIGGGTSLILSPDSEFFKFFGNIKQKQNQQ